MKTFQEIEKLRFCPGKLSESDTFFGHPTGSLGSAMSAYAGPYPRKAYPHGTMSKLVYPVPVLVNTNSNSNTNPGLPRASARWLPKPSHSVTILIQTRPPPPPPE